jgi:hypothetical protein
MMAEAKSREKFEAWISAPPTELSIERNSEDEEVSAWPGQYSDYQVQLAWEAWEECRNLITALFPVR